MTPFFCPRHAYIVCSKKVSLCYILKIEKRQNKRLTYPKQYVILHQTYIHIKYTADSAESIVKFGKFLEQTFTLFFFTLDSFLFLYIIMVLSLVKIEEDDGFQLVKEAKTISDINSWCKGKLHSKKQTKYFCLLTKFFGMRL